MTAFFKAVFSAHLMVYILQPTCLLVLHGPLQKAYNSMSVRTAVVY